MIEQKNGNCSPIGVFDSGYGGLTIFDRVRKLMPQYDYYYLGDNARTPYGSRSFDVVYEFTRQSVRQLYEMGCPLVILACNTASAKALRTIQQVDIPNWDSSFRVLGIIRPTVEQVGLITHSRRVGLLGTEGTIQSESYPIEFGKLFPDITVAGQACPMWVPLVENSEFASDGADYFVEKYIKLLLAQDSAIDTVVLGCTHYPLLLPKIEKYVPSTIKVVSQGDIVAQSLSDYLQRHAELEARLSKRGQCSFFTTESEEKFRRCASIFLKEQVDVERIRLGKN